MADQSGSLLLHTGVVNPGQLKAARDLRQREGGTIGECLVKIGAVSEEQLVDFYHRRLMIPRLGAAELERVKPEVLSLVPADLACELHVLPVEVDAEGSLTLAMSDPTDNHALDEVSFFAHRFIVRAVTAESILRRALERYYPASPAPSVPRGEARVARSTTAPRAAVSARKQAAHPGAAPRRPFIDTLHEQDPMLGRPPEPVVLLTKVKRRPEKAKPSDDETKPGVGGHRPVARSPRAAEKSRQETRTGHFATDGPPLESLRAAATRDQVGQIVLDYVGPLLRRTLLLVLKKSTLVGHDGRGPGTAQPLIQKLEVDVGSASLFRDVIRSRLPYFGPLPNNFADRAFAHKLGGVTSEVLLLPIAVRDRVIAVVFADGALSPLPELALHAMAREAGAAFGRIILANKG